MPQRNSARIKLKPAQQKVLAALREGSSTELTRGRYQALTGVSRSQAAYDIADLVAAGILERIGGGRSTRYRLVDSLDAGTTPRRWTSERIRTELDRFCSGRTTWPTAREFKRAGRTDLYVAASRYGGVRFWADALGLSRGSRELPPRPRRWSWAASGAGTGAFVVGVALAVAHPWSNGRPEVQPTRVTVVKQRTAAPAQPTRRAVKPRQKRAAVAKVAQATGSTRVPHATDTPATKPASAPPARISRRAPERPTAPAAGPVTPLAAPPASSSTPDPLPAP